MNHVPPAFAASDTLPGNRFPKYGAGFGAFDFSAFTTNATAVLAAPAYMAILLLLITPTAALAGPPDAARSVSAEESPDFQVLLEIRLSTSCATLSGS